MYTSHFKPSVRAEEILRSGNIIADEENPSDMINRVVNTIYLNDLKHTQNVTDSTVFSGALGEAMDNKLIVMSTPILTNAGRHRERPLTACTVPTLSLRNNSRELVQREIQMLHEQGMGTGFNLDDLDDPIEMLLFLNDIAIEGARSGREDRPVGNMAVLSIYHTKIMDYINIKNDTAKTWKFNISIDIDDAFMQALSNDLNVKLHNGDHISSRLLFTSLCEAASASGDPGILFLSRMNERNPVPELGVYKTTAPCAEVGLIEGETCQFGYINLANFIHTTNKATHIKIEELEAISHLLTRALDNALDISRDNFNSERGKLILDQKRKIGIGVCGVADALILSGLPYDSTDGRKLIQDMLSIINYSSKEESVRLAEHRGSCLAMNTAPGNRYMVENNSQLERLYSRYPNDFISSDDWGVLAEKIRSNRRLRNITTVALPPTGRSALVIDASTGIEPHFLLENIHQEALKTTNTQAQGVYTNEEVFRTAQQITPLGHIAMAAALQRFSDESLSKTINLPATAEAIDVADAYLAAYSAGMNGVTVYTDGAHNLQPIPLK